MIRCRFIEKKTLPNGHFLSSECINKAEILNLNDPCYGLCFACAYRQLRDENKSLKKALYMKSEKRE